jgi:hypothetical protein
VLELDNRALMLINMQFSSCGGRSLCQGLQRDRMDESNA